MYFRHHHRRHPLLWLGAFFFLSRLMRHRRFGPYGGWYGAPYGRHGHHGYRDPYYF